MSNILFFWRRSDNTFLYSENVGQKSGNVSLRDQLEALESLYGANNVETDVYYYHTDHLGSSSFITDANGIVTQCLQ